MTGRIKMSALMRMVMGSVAAWAVCGAVVLAAPPQKLSVDEVSEALNTGKQPAAATIDRIMDQAVRNIARRYNLNDVQTEMTNDLMKREVYAFIRDHESEVWPAIKDLLGTVMGTKPPEDPEVVKRIGKAARPLARMAEEAIYRANAEWREILTDEQKQVHDFDMAEMRTTFEQIDKNFAEWEKGKATDRIFPKPNMGANKLKVPEKPRDGIVPVEGGERIVEFNPADIFETLAEEFIEAYGLDDGQVTSARSIVEEYKGKARDFLDANKLQLAKFDVRRKQARDASDVAALKQVNAEHKQLLEPVYQLCSAMEDRLEGLLTRTQILRHQEKSEAKPSTKRASDAAKSKASKGDGDRTTKTRQAASGDGDNG